EQVDEQPRRRSRQRLVQRVLVPGRRTPPVRWLCRKMHQTPTAAGCCQAEKRPGAVTSPGGSSAPTRRIAHRKAPQMRLGYALELVGCYRCVAVKSRDVNPQKIIPP